MSYLSVFSRRRVKWAIAGSLLLGFGWLLTSGSSSDLEQRFQGDASRSSGGSQRDWFPFSQQTTQSHTGPSRSQGVIDLEDDIPLTTYQGGIPGYTVWSNLYLNSGTFISITPKGTPEGTSPFVKGQDGDLREKLGQATERLGEGANVDKAWLPTRLILSESDRKEASEDLWRVIELEQGAKGDEGEVVRGELGKTAAVLRGATVSRPDTREDRYLGGMGSSYQYVFADGPGPEGYLAYYRHFVLEAFLGASRVFASVFGYNVLPDRVWFIRCGQKPSWRDDRGENAWFLLHALPGTTVLDAGYFDDLAESGLSVMFEKVILVDRWAAHRSGGEVSQWNKMLTLTPTLPAPLGFFEPFRNNVLKSLGVREKTSSLPIVVYIDCQQQNSKLRPADHAAFIEALRSLTDVAEVHVTRLNAMTRPQQIGLLSRAQVVIGLHGDNLMGAMWLPASRKTTVVELFEQGGFVRDWELLVTALGHRYIAFQRDRVLDREVWSTYKGSRRGAEAQGEVHVDAGALVGIVRDIVVL